MLKRIHVNQHVIRANRKNGTTDAPLTVKTYKENHRAKDVQIHGESEVCYLPENPLSCGAVVWIETTAPVTVTHENGTKTLLR